ncbi:hypothetical protein EDM53_03420 [Rickettsiales endosymbiont of Peranema trichophorum]|uniref:hypothetical protein n=1 Tax=Rickettsiales endosymbiont of Peranema trichophorum TaxID=2486577 RepID=UPI0010234B1A|nr:hypothetical protein [Rickettsiales endosymbiont of Peranema trichophorum]RZI46995.1 hypothetical protein EDM53_03420 [Rickettsiales endosymbiont of Peranema trichophorum]
MCFRATAHNICSECSYGSSTHCSSYGSDGPEDENGVEAFDEEHSSMSNDGVFGGDNATLDGDTIFERTLNLTYGF